MSFRAKGPRLPLSEALRRFWMNLIGVTLFPFVAVITLKHYRLPIAVLFVLFLAAVVPAMWPFAIRNAPISYFGVAMAIWMAAILFAFVLSVMMTRSTA
jgi:hypothetical protein